MKLTEKKKLTGIQKAIIKLKKNGIQPERIALTAKISMSLVHKWMYGERQPNYVMREFLKSKFGVRIPT